MQFKMRFAVRVRSGVPRNFDWWGGGKLNCPNRMENATWNFSHYQWRIHEHNRGWILFYQYFKKRWNASIKQGAGENRIW